MPPPAALRRAPLSARALARMAPRPKPSPDSASAPSESGSRSMRFRRSRQSSTLPQPARMASPYLCARLKAVLSASDALTSLPSSAPARGPPCGMPCTNLHSEAMRWSITASMRWQAAMRATDWKPATVSRSTASSSAWSNTTLMAAMVGPQMVPNRSRSSSAPSVTAPGPAVGSGSMQPWPRAMARLAMIQCAVVMRALEVVASVILIASAEIDS